MAALTERTQRHQEYLDHLKQYPNLRPIGDAKKGEIELVTDLKTMAEIEERTQQKLGIVAQNRFSTCIYDPVLFPNGNTGFHGRFFGTPALDGVPGGAVLPIMPDGKILLICIFRHPTGWELEIPRGARNGSETIQALIRRELKEETGAEIGSEELLGSINPDSGMTVGNIPIVKVNISKMGNANPDDGSESSICLHAFTRDALDQAILHGYAEVMLNNTMQKVSVKDSFLLSALYIHDLRSRMNIHA